MKNLFLAFSARVTAFSVFELQGTGQAGAYFDAVQRVVGPSALGKLLETYKELGTGATAACDERLRLEVFGDPYLGPIARNIIKLWYVGTWFQLPRAWSDAYGACEGDVSFTVSASAYTEALLWPVVGSNPPGAKAPGYGSWAQPPTIPAARLSAPRRRS